MKYTFEIMKEYEDAFKGISVYSVSEDKKLMVDFVAREELEDAQKQVEEAYQRGLEDGKEYREKGCEGCEWEDKEYNTCTICRNSYKNLYERKKADDEIKVGDVVDWAGDKFIVTRIFQPHNNAEECDGVNMDGCTYHDVLISGLTKTGRHVDITDMLKGALE